MRSGKCTAVFAGDMIAVDGGFTKIRYHNVWAPEKGTELGDEAAKYNEELVLGKELRYETTGYIHYDNVSIVAEVYVDNLWVNQEVRYWLAKRVRENAG